jgi:hypothetical protein
LTPVSVSGRKSWFRFVKARAEERTDGELVDADRKGETLVLGPSSANLSENVGGVVLGREVAGVRVVDENHARRVAAA